jgi:SAM-dependent methyltransferase
VAVQSTQAQTTAFRRITRCRVCNNDDLISVLDLGVQPLANGFRQPIDFGKPEPRYPLHVLQCSDCGLVQLDGVVDPTIMYGSHYPYRSGYSEGWALHCHALAKEIGQGKRVLEIGCLDGVMLRHCRDNGCDVQGIDPSAPAGLEIPISREFFTSKLDCHRPYDYVIAQNVFGHVDDVHDFMEGVVFHLAPEGACIIECPWVADLVNNAEWDTVYHEHLSYWGVKPMMRLAKDVGLCVNAVKHFPEIHGGTLRYYLSRRPTIDMKVFDYWGQEEFDSEDWAELRSQFSMGVIDAEVYFAQSGPRIAGYGASAKFNTYLNALPTRPPLVGIFDDNPHKVGLLTPGWGFHVLPPTRDRLEQVDVLLVGAPNWKEGIEKKARERGFTGEVRSLWG